jgi:thioredoxin-related protein
MMRKGLIKQVRDLLAGIVVLGLTASTLAAADTKSNKIELIMFEQFGCEWCEIWNEQIGVVYHKTSEGARAPLRRVDIHETRPDDLKDVKSIVFTPTFVLMENGLEVGRIKGYPGEDFFWGMLDELIRKLRPNMQQSKVRSCPTPLFRST